MIVSQSADTPSNRSSKGKPTMHEVKVSIPTLSSSSSDFSKESLLSFVDGAIEDFALKTGGPTVKMGFQGWMHEGHGARLRWVKAELSLTALTDTEWCVQRILEDAVPVVAGHGPEEASDILADAASRLDDWSESRPDEWRRRARGRGAFTGLAGRIATAIQDCLEMGEMSKEQLPEVMAEVSERLQH